MLAKINHVKLEPWVKTKFTFQEARDSEEFIGGKKSKKIRKIRKHQGINQQTGRLKKGFRYSGKTLKSGLKQIVKQKK